LVPLGFVVQNATHDGAITVITVRRATGQGFVRDAGRFGADTVAITAASRTFCGRAVLLISRPACGDAAGQIDAFYSAEGAALALVDSGDVRLLIPLPDLYPKPYAAVVIWATDDTIQHTPELVAAFVRATLLSVKYLQDHPSYASELYIKRTNSQKNVADKVVAALNAVLTPSGRGSGSDLVASVAGNWRFMKESGAVSADTAVNIEEVVDARFLPPTQ
jgi:NMT1/THI5 like